jgi:hypothetical protein
MADTGPRIRATAHAMIAVMALHDLAQNPAIKRFQ